MERIKETEVNEIIARSRELHAEFDHMVNEFKGDLWKYCHYITGSQWDGEDLFQETMLKAYASFCQRWHPTNPKSYLYRIATNAWIDRCRREKKFVDELKEEDLPAEEIDFDFDIEDAVHHLIELFTPRQIAVFFLKEVFSFTAEEAAGMVHTTRGAVYATVRRMKKAIKEYPPRNDCRKKGHLIEESPVIDVYLKALNDGNVEGILSLLSDTAHNEAALGFQEYNKSEMRSGSLKYGLPGYRAEKHLLWGKEVIVVFNDNAEAPEIHDIHYQEVENEKIVYHLSYYFRKEFIMAASKELGCKPQLDKPVVNW
jgi:RNA polymerase sigma factor (sigma-70 family)